MEHEKLFRNERPKLVENLQKAANEGDRSENAEYIYTKKRIREIDYRIRYLNSLLKDAVVVEPNSIKDVDRVGFASSVTVRDINGKTHDWIIVGEGESDFHDNGISWKSLMGQALFGKKLGNKVKISTPSGKKNYQIITINKRNL